MGGASRILMLLSTPFPLLCLRPSSTSAIRVSARHSPPPPPPPPPPLPPPPPSRPAPRHSRPALSSVAGHPPHLHSPRSAPLPRPKSLIRSQLHTQSAQREPLGDSPLSTSLPNSR